MDIYILYSFAIIFRCIFLKLGLSLDHAMFTVDCQNGTVAWGPRGDEYIYNVAVKYKCDNDTQVRT